MLTIVGGNYPPHPTNVLLSRLVTVFQFAFIILLVAGDYIFPRLGMAPPAFYVYLSERKMMAVALTFFLGNQISGGLLSTGAFEISLDGHTIFSKLAENRVPSIEEVAERIMTSGAVSVGVPFGKPM
eukprot:Opistho-1_new@83613